MSSPHLPVVLFDGVCNLCNGAVQFIIKRDHKAVFHFAALQSGAGKTAIGKLPGEEMESNTIILVDDDGVFERSTAVLKIARRLNGAWPALYVFIIIPRFIRDWIYDLVARNRYRIFGRSESCMVPAPELRNRFID